MQEGQGKGQFLVEQQKRKRENYHMEMQYRLGTMQDLEEIFEIFQAAIDNMNRNGIPQWDEKYPTREDLEADIRRGELYLGLENSRIAAVYVLNQRCDPEYADGQWNYPEDTYYIIHRLCVNPVFQNHGIAVQAIQHIEQELVLQGIQSIRLDAFTLNPYALRLYDKLGYSIVGHADWRMGRFYLMEKHLEGDQVKAEAVKRT